MAVAHCGDSRGVMGELHSKRVKQAKTTLETSVVSASSDGSTVRLSDDHKPNRPDEVTRLKQANGHVVEINGVWRVFTPQPVKLGNKVLQVRRK